MKTLGISQNKKDINIMVMHNSNKGFDKTARKFFIVLMYFVVQIQ